MVKRGLICSARCMRNQRLPAGCTVQKLHVAVVHAVFFTTGATQFDFRVMPILDMRSRYLEQISMFSAETLQTGRSCEKRTAACR